MAKWIVTTLPDGTCAITHPIGEPSSEETEAQWLSRIIEQDTPVISTASFIDDGGNLRPIGSVLDRRLATRRNVSFTDLPSTIVDSINGPINKEYRRGWVLQANTVIHDMPHCRNIHRKKIQDKRRLEVFPDLDGQWQRAMGRGDTAQAAVIEAKREAWRNAPQDPAIDAATTIDQLKAIPLPPT